MQVLKDSVKDAILASAEELLIRYGYSGMTMRMIASSINMSVSNLYKYFPDKQSIYKELVLDTFNGAIARLNDFFKEKNKGNYTGENIQYVCSGLSNRLMSHRAVFIILLENSYHPECLPFKQILVKNMSSHITDGTSKESGFEPFIISLFVQSIWEGIQAIIKETNEFSLLYDRLYHLLKYHFKGLSLFHDL